MVKISRKKLMLEKFRANVQYLSFLDLLPYQLLSDCWSYIDNDENVASLILKTLNIVCYV